MQNLQEGYRGSQLRGLECPVRAQVPRPCSVPLALGAGRKNTDEERGLAAQGRGAGGSRGMSLRPSAVRGQENRTTLCPYIPTTPAPRGGQPLTHLHDKPRTLCSSRGACSWDNPIPKWKKEVLVPRTGNRTPVWHQNPLSSGTSYNPAAPTPRRQPQAFRHWRLQGKLQNRAWLSPRELQAAPSPTSRPPPVGVWSGHSQL